MTGTGHEIEGRAAAPQPRRRPTTASAELAALREMVEQGGCVVILLGPSGAGKSTLAARLAAETGAVVVSYDAHQREAPGDDGGRASPGCGVDRAEDAVRRRRR